MIVDFTVENFGCIKEPQTISFEATEYESAEDVFIAKPDGETRLLRMLVLLGPHGSGKSTMLEALKFCRVTMLDMIFGDSPQRLSSSHILMGISSGYDLLSDEETKIEINFIAHGIKFNYSIHLTKKMILNRNRSFTYKGELPNTNFSECEEKAFDDWVNNNFKRLADATMFLEKYGLSLGEGAFKESRCLLDKIKGDNLVAAIDNFGIGLNHEYSEDLLARYLREPEDSLGQVILSVSDIEVIAELLYYRHDLVYFAENLEGNSEFHSLSDYKGLGGIPAQKICDWIKIGRIGSYSHCAVDDLDSRLDLEREE